MSVLTDVLPARWRKRLYLAYALLVALVGAVQAGFGSVSAAQPKALTVALAVLAYVGAALGITAASNTNADKGE